MLFIRQYKAYKYIILAFILTNYETHDIFFFFFFLGGGGVSTKLNTSRPRLTQSES